MIYNQTIVRLLLKYNLFVKRKILFNNFISLNIVECKSGLGYTKLGDERRIVNFWLGYGPGW